MKYNEVRPAKGAVKKRVRRGRGNASGLGGEAGRGHKGQKARSGGSIRPGFEGGQTPLYRRLPKRKGFNNYSKVSVGSVNLGDLERTFSDGESVNLSSLLERGLVKKCKSLKILGEGELTKKIKMAGT